jgi:superfamily II DNA or RNA helicase
MNKVQATTEGNRILVRFPYTTADVALVKSVMGARPIYDGRKFRHWSLPLTPETCQGLRAVFGDRLQVTTALADWYRAERDRRGELEQLRAGSVSDLPRVREMAPMLWEALQNRPFQITGTAFVVRGRQVCLGDAPRLGKTYQALAAAVETGAKRILIACPRTATRTVWMRKINELTGIMPFVAQGSHAEREQAIANFNDMPTTGPKALIINKEMIRVVRSYACPDGTENRCAPGRKGGCDEMHDHKNVYNPEWPQLFEGKWHAIILDECHHALASTKNKQSAAISQIRMGAVRLPTHPDTLKLAMSGTPFRANLNKAWGVLNWLRPDVFGSFWRFAETHFHVSHDGYGKVVGNKPKDETAFTDALRPYYLARSLADVAPELRPIEYVNVELPMDEKQNKAYRGMARMATASVENGTLSATGVLAELTRLKQLACSYGRFSPSGSYVPALPSNKWDWLLDFLSERESVPGKVVIATQFTQLANMFVNELRAKGHAVVVITGESSDAQREHAQNEFATGPTRIAVINMFAGGEAIDLSAADEMVFLDDPWTDDVVQQAENRILNLAKTSQLTVFHLRSENTLESWIAGLTAEQRKLLLSSKPQALTAFKEAVA